MCKNNNHRQLQSSNLLSEQQQQDDIIIVSALPHKDQEDTIDAKKEEHIEPFPIKYPQEYDNLAYDEPLNDCFVSCSPLNANANKHSFRCQEEQCMKSRKDQQITSQHECNSISNFQQRKKRKKKIKQRVEHLATTLSFPYKQLLNRDSANDTGGLWQHNDDDADRVQFMEKYFIPQWQFEFMKVFYVQGSSCKSYDKYLEYVSDEKFGEQNRNELIGKQEEEEREYGASTLINNFSCHDPWDNKDHEQHYFIPTRPSKTSRVELIVAYDFYIEESKKLMTYIDYSDLSRSKVASFEKEMNIDREKILRRLNPARLKASYTNAHPENAYR